MPQQTKGNRKRRFRGRKVRAEKLIQPPADQSFRGGFSITFNHYVDDVTTGARTKFVERKCVRFPNAMDMSDYYEQNRRKQYHSAPRRNDAPASA